MGANAVRFKQTNVPRQGGEQGRLKVVQGPDLGVVYVLTGNRVTIGRGEDNDIVITDLKASRNHMEIARDAQGWAIRDLGSANGLLHNGKATRAARLRSGESIGLGATVMEFIASEAATSMLVAPGRSPAELAAHQAAIQTQKRRVHSLAKFGGGAPGGMPRPVVAGASEGANHGRILLYGGAGLLVLLMMMEDPAQKKPSTAEPNSKSAAAAVTEKRGLAAYLPESDLPEETERSVQQFFEIGFREYRAKNYLRAKKQFETALQVDPNHHLSRLYLANCDKSIEEEVKLHLQHGKRSRKIGRIRDAKGHFESVLRLLYRDRSNPHYIEAEEQLQELEIDSGGTT